MHALNAGKREAEAKVAEKRKELKKVEDQFNQLKRQCVLTPGPLTPKC
jgi:hypothetical protein